MTDGILLSPYPMVNYNHFAPEGRVAFQSSDAKVRPNMATATTTATTAATTTHHNIEDSTALELRTRKFKDRYNEKEEHKALAAEEVAYIKSGQNCLLALGITFTFLALAAAVVAFGTPEWRNYSVNEMKLGNILVVNPSLRICTTDTTVTTCQFFTSRSRGLFVTCYADSTIIPQAFPNAQTSPWVNGYSCVWEQKYNIQQTPIMTAANCQQDNSQQNGQAMVDTNMNIMRTQWLAFAVAILCLFIGLIFTFVSCKQMRVGGSMCAGVLLLFAVILLLLGMVLFHVYTYMEEESLRCPPFYGAMKKDIYSGVNSNTTAYFGFSFYLGWSSFAMAILGCGFVLGAACQRRQAQLQIDKAMYRITQLTKEERVEKKFEEMENKKKRKDMQNQMKSEAKLQTPSYNGGFMQQQQQQQLQQQQQMNFDRRPQTSFYNGGFMAMINKIKKPKIRNVSDSEIDYDVGDLKREKEARLRKLRYDAENEIEFESSKIKLRKEKQLKELKNAKRDLEDMEKRIKVLEKSKKQKEKMKWGVRKDSLSESDDDSDVVLRKSHHKTQKRCVSVDSFSGAREGNWFSIDRKCGRVVSPPQFHQQSCCDPYTLHLPTGFNPPPYQP